MANKVRDRDSGEDQTHVHANDARGAPVFKRCVRCRYLLRGLPANHACPECGLAFDERCELFRVRNPKQVLLTWGLIFFGGAISLRRLADLPRWSSMGLFDKIYTGSAIVFMIILFVFVGFAYRKLRRGLEIAVTGDGLYLNLMGRDDGLIPWTNIKGAKAKANPNNKPNAHIVEVNLKDDRKRIWIGGVQQVFGVREDVERFVRHVRERVEALAAGASPDSPEDPASASV